jgi:DNA-binding SARP family transcriptional activator
MGALRISLFGTVRVAHDGSRSDVAVARAVQALLAYLLLHRHRGHPREVLTGLFWPDHSDERARGCLSTALWRLRRVLEPTGVTPGTYLLTSPAGEVRFNCANEFWLDVGAFEDGVGRALARPLEAMDADDARALGEAVQLYSGELLDGFYDDWALRERERLRLRYLDGLVRLMRYHGRHDAYEEALARGQDVLRHDPLREEIHREVMRLHAKAGQRARAARQYESLREILGAELGIAPMPETQALYEQLVQPASLRRSTASQAPEPGGLPQALRQLRVALQDLDRAREQLQRAIRLVEQSSKDRGQIRAG